MLAGLTYPSLIATGAYGLVMLAAAAAVRAGQRTGQPGAEVRSWMLVIACFAVFAALRLGAVEDVVRQFLRDVMLAQGSYEERRDLQRMLLAGLVAVGSPALFAMGFYLFRRSRRPRALAVSAALCACAAMVVLIVMRTVSYHGLDALLFGPLKLAWVGDVGISAAVAAAAVFYVRRSRSRVKRARR